jgi:hypothetical protein
MAGSSGGSCEVSLFFLKKKIKFFLVLGGGRSTPQGSPVWGGRSHPCAILGGRPPLIFFKVFFFFFLNFYFDLNLFFKK